MDGLVTALKTFFQLLTDPEVVEISWLSLKVSGLATLIATLLMIPLAIFLHKKGGRYLRVGARLAYLFTGVPSVVVGLIFLILFSNDGPLGFVRILYSPSLMVLAQAFLIMPLVLGFSLTLLARSGQELLAFAKTMGAGTGDYYRLMLLELKSEFTGVILLSFSRAVAEVGTVMVVGGNIRFHTRVMTTAISMMSSMGDYEKALVLGIILFVITLLINLLVMKISGGDYGY